MIKPVRQRPNITFAPARRDDGRYALELREGEQSYGFLHFIENTDGTMCRSSNRNICKSFYSEEEAQGLCEELTRMYSEGEIG